MARRTSKHKTKEEIVEEVKTEEVKPVKQEEKKATPKKRARRKKVERDEMIPVMNNTSGKLVYKSPKSGQQWYFNEYAQEDEIEFGELMTMNNSTRMLKNHSILILDEDAVSALGLTRLYENVLDPSDVEHFFDLSADEMESKLNKLPDSFKVLIAGLAKNKVINGELDSMSKMRVIEDKLKVNLTGL